MKTLPVPRPGVYDVYWRFAAERQRIFEQRLIGGSAPWTDDPVLATYKFCNVFRAADRVSQYLIRDVCYREERVADVDRLFQIVAFRVFSRTETWATLLRFLGRSPTIEDLGDGGFGRALDYARKVNGRLYTGAFILCATNAYGKTTKHENHIELFRHMFIHDSLGERLLEAKSLGEIYELLRLYPLIGDFMSYQIAVDLNYSSLISFSENDFTKAGPGALRGIKKCFLSLGDYTPEDTIAWMVERQEAEFARLGLVFNGLGGRPLHAIDCQGLFCETDKYCRVVVPELASARKQIKAKFTPAANPITYFFPPKWDIHAVNPNSVH